MRDRHQVTYFRVGGEVLAYLGRGFGVVRIPDMPIGLTAPVVQGVPTPVRVNEPESSADA